MGIVIISATLYALGSIAMFVGRAALGRAEAGDGRLSRTQALWLRNVGVAVFGLGILIMLPRIARTQ